VKVLWLRPSTGENVSVRRERIAEHLEEWGVDVTIRDTSGFDSIGAFKEALFGDYDIIAGNVRVGLYLGYPLARILRKPFLGDVSDPLSDIKGLPAPLYKAFSWYEWFVLRHSDAAVFVYESSYEEAARRGIDGFRLPNAVNFDSFANPLNEVITESKQILDSVDVDFNSRIAIYTGILDDVHHITDIVESARLNSDWEYVFVGEGPIESEVTAASNELPNVYYPGSFEHRLMPGFLYHADAGFCFKDAEQTLKLKEYAAAGLPTLVQPGELGKWYDNDELIFVNPNAESIAETLLDLQDDGVIKEYSEGVRKAVDTRTWKEIAEAYQQIFTELSET